MSNSDDLNLLQKFPVNNGEGIARESRTLRAIKIGWIKSGKIPYLVKSRNQLCIETICSMGTLLGIPVVSGHQLPRSGRVQA